MATYVVQAPAHAGGTVSLQAVGGSVGDLTPTGTGIGLLLQAGTAASAGGTITLPVAPTYDGQVVTSRTFAFSPNQLVLIPLPTSVYGVGTTAVNYAYGVAPTVAAIQVAT